MRWVRAAPILANALQDAGCENSSILDHCRDTGPVHVRGCWVVDLVPGKEQIGAVAHIASATPAALLSKQNPSVHSRAEVTQVYAETNAKPAEAVVRKLG